MDNGKQDVWTGPPLGNPRNRHVPNWKTGSVTASGHTEAGRALLRGEYRLVGLGPCAEMFVIEVTGERISVGHVNPTEFFVEPGTKVQFLGWEWSPNGSTAWRVAYLFRVDVKSGTFAIDRYDVAPDIDDGSETPKLPA